MRPSTWRDVRCTRCGSRRNVSCWKPAKRGSVQMKFLPKPHPERLTALTVAQEEWDTEHPEAVASTQDSAPTDTPTTEAQK